MEKTVFISLPLEDLQTVIIDCVNSCLKNSKHVNTETSHDVDQWLDLTELCEYLPDKPSKATVYGWVHKGLIPHYKGSKKLSFLKSEIDQWLKTGKRKTYAETAIDADNYLKSKKTKRI